MFGPEESLPQANRFSAYPYRGGESLSELWRVRNSTGDLVLLSLNGTRHLIHAELLAESPLFQQLALQSLKADRIKWVSFDTSDYPLKVFIRHLYERDWNFKGHPLDLIHITTTLGMDRFLPTLDFDGDRDRTASGIKRACRRINRAVRFGITSECDRYYRDDISSIDLGTTMNWSDVCFLRVDERIHLAEVHLALYVSNEPYSDRYIASRSRPIYLPDQSGPLFSDLE
jgi:hypothetical protein